MRAYTTHLAPYLRQWSRRRYRQPKHLRSLLATLPPDARVLDLGSGPGQDARFLRRQGYTVVGVDLTWAMLRHARRRSRRLFLVQADLRNLPFRSDHPFEAVWAAASLIHLPKRALPAVLRAFRRIVGPAGTLGATLLHGRGAGYLRAGWIPDRYCSRWHKAELARAVRQAKWEILSLTTVANRERKGRWLNLLARAPLGRSPRFR
ncbi:MAG: class I SAM-dependent methyltransferase [Nitrospirales bacterium]